MNERISNLLASRWTLPVSTGLVGVGIGALAGYHIAKLKLTTELVEELEDCQEEVSENPDQLQFDFDEKTEKLNETIEGAALVARQMTAAGEALRDTVTNLQARHIAGDVDYAMSVHPSANRLSAVEVTDESEDEGVVKGRLSSRPITEDDDEIEEHRKVVNIFDNAGDEWDYKTELENRNPNEPYIIHVDEYVNDEMGWGSQSTLTWYEGDQILCDPMDRPIYNHHEVVGELIFGHGSNDANVVYIRNEKLKTEFEILRDSGSYEDAVLSAAHAEQIEEDELRHSASRRFRDE